MDSATNSETKNPNFREFFETMGTSFASLACLFIPKKIIRLVEKIVKIQNLQFQYWLLDLLKKIIYILIYLMSEALNLKLSLFVIFHLPVNSLEALLALHKVSMMSKISVKTLKLKFVPVTSFLLFTFL